MADRIEGPATLERRIDDVRALMVVRDLHSQVGPPRLLRHRAGLVRHIERYIDDWNEHPTPFVWTNDPSRHHQEGGPPQH